MTCRSAILIDNFLDQHIFEDISRKVSNSPEYTLGECSEPRDDLMREIQGHVWDRLKQIGLYQPHMPGAAEIFGYNQFRPANYGHGNFNGPHTDHGGYVFYIHPDWSDEWDGVLDITNAVEEEYHSIHATPNRWIWIEPHTYHNVTTTSSTATHCRVTNIAFLGNNIYVDPVECDFINIITST